MRKYVFLWLLPMLLLLWGCAASGEKQNVSTEAPPVVENPVAAPQLPPEKEAVPLPTQPVEPPPPDPRQEAVSAILDGMTLEEKVGQMFFVQGPAQKQAELAVQYHLGGYLLFTRDFKDSAGGWLSREDFTEKIASWQTAAAVPLLIGVDEEGGTVARATRNPNLSPSKRKSPQQVYAAGGMEAIREDAAAVSDLLLGLGINVNFAPVADVSTDPGDFIYDRAFGQDADATAAYISAAVSTMEHSGIGSVLKHFPGYGSNVDTHTGIALDRRPYDTFLTADLLPFRTGIEAGAGAVLVSHNIVACMDDALPASLSPAVHRVLREELAFDGVVLTDDLAMDAVETYAEGGSVAVLAVLAGNDMVVTADFQTQIPAVIAAVEEGRIPMETIDHAAARVLGWKYDLGLLSGPETGD